MAKKYKADGWQVQERETKRHKWVSLHSTKMSTKEDAIYYYDREYYPGCFDYGIDENLARCVRVYVEDA